MARRGKALKAVSPHIVQSVSETSSHASTGALGTCCRVLSAALWLDRELFCIVASRGKQTLLLAVLGMEGG